MIQMLINSSQNKKFLGPDMMVNRPHDAESLDAFDVNIINLQDENIWQNKGKNNQSINTINDFTSLSQMIKNSRNSQIIILLPQNYIFKFHFYGGKYTQQCEIKDMLKTFKEKILKTLYLPLQNIDLIYENNHTKLENIANTSAFCIKDVDENNVLTRSEKSLKITTAYVGEVILSTILLDDYEAVMRLLRELDLYHNNDDCPEWMYEINMFNDIELKQSIQTINQEISQKKHKICELEENLKRNQRYKSILYTSGKQLVEVVYEILGKMLGCDLVDFVDIHKEDFCFEIGDTIFLGEIKGISSNIQNMNVAQLDIHVQEYIDKHTEENKKIVALLIINYQRNKPLPERNDVHNDQIKLAKRNGSLIIDTQSLLELFGQFLSGKVSSEQCIEIFKQNNGLLEMN